MGSSIGTGAQEWRGKTRIPEKRQWPWVPKRRNPDLAEKATHNTPIYSARLSMAEWSCRKPQCELGRELPDRGYFLPCPNFRGEWMNGKKNITKKDLIAHAPNSLRHYTLDKQSTNDNQALELSHLNRLQVGYRTPRPEQELHVFQKEWINHTGRKEQKRLRLPHKNLPGIRLVPPAPGFQGVIEKRTPVIHAVHDVLNPGLYLLPLGIPEASARAGAWAGG